MRLLPLLLGGLAAALTGCTTGSAPTSLLLEASAFDTTLDNRPVSLHTLRNDRGMAVQITNYGARVVSLVVPDRDGTPTDVVWGYPTIGQYLASDDVYSGPIVGRFGNRIARGRFTLDSTTYQLSINNAPNHLHGGNAGVWNRVWEITSSTDSSLTLHYLSPDGEDGYPGNLSMSVTYTVTADNALRLSYDATTDRPTPCNLTWHPYFNLHGRADRSTDSHKLYVCASRYTPTDSTLIPTGEILPVAETPADFRTPTAVGAREYDTTSSLIRYGKGYDLNFVLDKTGTANVEKAAELYEPSNGILLTIYTDQPGLQFYSGGCISPACPGKQGQQRTPYSGIALETQNFPDAPNQPAFPNSILRPGEHYNHQAIYQFSTK